MGMVNFVTSCFENLGCVGVKTLLSCNKWFFKYIFSWNYIKVELKIEGI